MTLRPLLQEYITVEEQWEKDKEKNSGKKQSIVILLCNVSKGFAYNRLLGCH